MDEATRKLVERLHASPTMAVVVITGGGAQALAWLLSVPGASRTVLEASVPYSPAALARFLSYKPEQAVSVQTARDMARAAYKRALRLRMDDQPVVGVAATASIATDRPKLGEHRCHIAVWSASGVATYSLEFTKGLRNRQGEDEVVSRLALLALAEASQVEPGLPLALDPREGVEAEKTCYEDPIKALLAGHISNVTVRPNGSALADGKVRGAILPGSFNPLHAGHERLADVAAAVLKAQVAFELSITNVDKPPLEEAEVRRRAGQFAGKYEVILSRAPAFIQKAAQFPGCAFVIGWDTAVRLVDARYYDGKVFRMLAALEEIRRLGCRFLVAGRVEAGVFRTLEDVAIPQGFEEMFQPIPESAFRLDLSSTELRSATRQR